MRPLFLNCWLAMLVVAFEASGNAASDEFALGVRTTEPLAPTDQQKRFKLPPGFEIQLVAAEPDIHKPMNLAFDAAGRLWVTTSIEYPWAAPTNRPARDRLMIFEDFGPDGRARKVTQFADGLNIPIGIYPFRNDDTRWKALVWSIPHIWLFEDTDADGKADKRTPLYGPFDHTRDTHGNQASFRRGFDGWLYATHGFNNDSHVTARDGTRADLNSGNTYRIRLNGERIEQHTHGQVNPFGLAWDPRGNLYSSDCHSAPIYQLLAGGWYPSFGKPHDGLGFAPAMLEHAHGSTAIDGAFYYTDDLWPAEYQDTFLIGNVMTSRLNRDRITFIGSTPKAIEQPDFLSTTDPWFRPVDNILGPDGALYTADFYNRIIGHYEVPLTHPGRDRERGRIWRVVYKGQDGKATLRNTALAPDLDGLIAELGSPNLTRRLSAMAEIEDRFGQGARAALRAARRQEASSIQEVHLLWLLQRLDDLQATELTWAAESAEPILRIHAQRIAADVLYRAGRRLQLPENLVLAAQTLAIKALNDPDALVIRCAAEALGQLPHANSVRPILDAVAKADHADTHLVYVLRKSLRDHLHDHSIFSGILESKLSAHDIRAIVDVALAVKSEHAGRFLIKHNQTYTSDAVLSRRALEHAARYAPPAAIDELTTTIQRDAHGDLELQLALLRALRDGFARRGLELSPRLKSWAGKLSLQLLDSAAGPPAWANQPIDANSTSSSPWGFRERQQADTREPARLFDSSVRGEQLTGRLVSRPFPAPPHLKFFLAGHDGDPAKPAQGRNAVHLRDQLSGEILATAKPTRNDTAQSVAWNLAPHAGKQVRIEVVDGDNGGAFAWIAFGRFDPPVVPPPVIASERQVAAAELAAAASAAKDSALWQRLRAVSRDPEADLAARAAILRLVNPAGASIADLVADAQAPASWKIRLINAFTTHDSVIPAALQASAFKEAPQRVQVHVAMLALPDADAASELVSQMESGSVSPSLLRDQTLFAKLNGTGREETRTRITQLQATLPPVDASIQQLIDQRRRDFTAARPDGDQGRQLYTQLCAICHQLDGLGALIGPQLDGIGNRGVERLLEDILDPNRNVDHAFATTTLTLKDGEVASGLFRREEGALLVLANAGGQEFTVAKADVAGRRDSSTSLMPTNFGEALTTEQLNHLLAFLLTQRK